MPDKCTSLSSLHWKPLSLLRHESYTIADICVLFSSICHKALTGFWENFCYSILWAGETDYIFVDDRGRGLPWEGPKIKHPRQCILIHQTVIRSRCYRSISQNCLVFTVFISWPPLRWLFPHGLHNEQCDHTGNTRMNASAASFVVPRQRPLRNGCRNMCGIKWIAYSSFKSTAVLPYHHIMNLHNFTFSYHHSEDNRDTDNFCLYSVCKPNTLQLALAMMTSL